MSRFSSQLVGGRAPSWRSLRPADGPIGDESWRDLLRAQRELHESARSAAPHADAIVASPEGRRRLTQLITTNFDHIPSALLCHQLLGVAGCRAAGQMIELGLHEGGWNIDAEKIACPVRIVWGTEDRLLPWPRAAARYRQDWLPQADWVVLDGIGHCPQLDAPLETAQLVLDFTAR